MKRDRHEEHRRLEHAMVLAALCLPPAPPIPPQSSGNRARIDPVASSRVKGREGTAKRTGALVGPNTPLFTITQAVILHEARKIREIPDYRPPGWMMILKWATRIEEEHAR